MDRIVYLRTDRSLQTRSLPAIGDAFPGSRRSDRRLRTARTVPVRRHGLAIAVAAAMTGAMTGTMSPAAHAATVFDQDGTTLELYGNLQFAYSALESGGPDGTSDGIADNGSTLGVRGERVVGNRFTGYFRYEFEGDADEINDGGGLDTGDQAYFGVRGAYGDGRVGSWDPLIDEWIQDPISNNEFFDVTDSSALVEGDDGVNTQGEGDTNREGDKLQYTSPAVGGFRAAIGFQYKGSREAENVSDSGTAAPYLGVEFAADALRVAAVWDSLDNFDGDASGRVFIGPDGADLGQFDAGDQFGITAQYELAAVRLAVKYEYYASGDSDIVPDEHRVGLGARGAWGRGDVYGAYQYVDVDGGALFSEENTQSFIESDQSYNEFVVGATLEWFDSAYAFLEAASYDRKDDVGNGVALGAAYLF